MIEVKIRNISKNRHRFRAGLLTNLFKRNAHNSITHITRPKLCNFLTPPFSRAEAQVLSWWKKPPNFISGISLGKTSLNLLRYKHYSSNFCPYKLDVWDRNFDYLVLSSQFFHKKHLWSRILCCGDTWSHFTKSVFVQRNRVTPAVFIFRWQYCINPA